MGRSNYNAYLVVICNKETNAVEQVAIWSSPEWEQSRNLTRPTYVAYSVGHKDSFHDARQELIRQITDERSRYHWLVKHFAEDLAEEVQFYMNH